MNNCRWTVIFLGKPSFFSANLTCPDCPEVFWQFGLFFYYLGFMLTDFPRAWTFWVSFRATFIFEGWDLHWLFSGPPTADAPVVRGYFGVGAESGTRASRFECKDSVAVKHKGWLVLFQRSGLIFLNSTDSFKIFWWFLVNICMNSFHAVSKYLPYPPLVSASSPAILRHAQEGISLAAGERSERLAPNRLPKDLPPEQLSPLEVAAFEKQTTRHRTARLRPVTSVKSLIVHQDIISERFQNFSSFFIPIAWTWAM